MFSTSIAINNRDYDDEWHEANKQVCAALKLETRCGTDVGLFW